MPKLLDVLRRDLVYPRHPVFQLQVVRHRVRSFLLHRDLLTHDARQERCDVRERESIVSLYVFEHALGHPGEGREPDL